MRAERAVVDRAIVAVITFHDRRVLGQSGDRERGRKRHECYCALHRKLLDVETRWRKPHLSRVEPLQGVHIRSVLDSKHAIPQVNRRRLGTERDRGGNEEPHRRRGQRLGRSIRGSERGRLARGRQRDRSHRTPGRVNTGRRPGTVQVGPAQCSAVRRRVRKSQRTRRCRRAAQQADNRRLHGNQSDDHDRDGLKNPLHAQVQYRRD
jgi:hypothetical protein